MVPVLAQSAEGLLSWEDGSRRAVALHHALLHRRPGVWANRARQPRSVVLLRRGEACWEAFGAGDPEPAAAWLARRRAPVCLLAPEGWAEAIAARVRGPVERKSLAVRALPEAAVRRPGRCGGVIVERIEAARVDAFAAAVPPGGLRAWESAGQCLAEGGAVGVPYSGGFAAVAWVAESDRHMDVVGVYTDPRYRRLGLGRAAAAGLIGRILGARRREPLWAARPENEASLALARLLGFTVDLDEPLLRFGRGELAADPGPEGGA